MIRKIALKIVHVKPKIKTPPWASSDAPGLGRCNRAYSEGRRESPLEFEVVCALPDFKSAPQCSQRDRLTSDTLLIDAPLGELDDSVRRTQEHMAELSRIVLDGLELRSEAKVVRAPERWRDARGGAVWRAPNQSQGEVEGGPDTPRRPPAR